VGSGTRLLELSETWKECAALLVGDPRGLMAGLGGTGATPLLERLGRSAADGVGGARGGDNPNHPVVPSSKRKASGPWWGHVLTEYILRDIPGPWDANVYRCTMSEEYTGVVPGPADREGDKLTVYRYTMSKQLEHCLHGPSPWGEYEYEDRGNGRGGRRGRPAKRAAAERAQG